MIEPMEARTEPKEESLVDRLRRLRLMGELHPAIERIETWERIAFGRYGAELINLILYKVRESDATTVELTFDEVERAFKLKRRRQQAGLDRLLKSGVLKKLRGGYRDVRRFEFDPDEYEAIRAGVEGWDPVPFVNKYEVSAPQLCSCAVSNSGEGSESFHCDG